MRELEDWFQKIQKADRDSYVDIKKMFDSIDPV